jgi:hypothetical protein
MLSRYDTAQQASTTVDGSEINDLRAFGWDRVERALSS